MRLADALAGSERSDPTERGPDPHWRLRDGPIRLAAGEEVGLRAKAVRYGYAESDERVATFAAE